PQGFAGDRIPLYCQRRDNTILYPYLNAEDHLLYAAQCYGLPQSRVDEVIDYIGIGDFIHKRTVACSLGMKQLILLALAILNKPAVLVMDEPLNGLDPGNVIRFRQMMLDLVAGGTTILLSSHSLAEIDAVTKHIFSLKNHTIQEEFLLPKGGNHDQQRAEDRYREIYSPTFDQKS
ncbi:MAG: AAA family ATPase, partial [Eubacteriales bacterium]|nr:AAA family ATPase [Eubacteriales bacterium]